MAEKPDNTLTVNGNEYSIDELSPEQLRMLTQYRFLSQKITEAEFELERLVAAREHFTGRLTASLEAPVAQAAE